jgi:hypothetical protein
MHACRAQRSALLMYLVYHAATIDYQPAGLRHGCTKKRSSGQEPHIVPFSLQQHSCSHRSLRNVMLLDAAPQLAGSTLQHGARRNPDMEPRLACVKLLQQQQGRPMLIHVRRRRRDSWPCHWVGR